MCMGCGSTFLQSSDGQAPDAIDTTIWLVAIALWVVWLHHMKGRLMPYLKHKKEQTSNL